MAAARKDLPPEAARRNIRLLLEYDGTDFSGWQVQPGRRTVQGVLEDKLSQLLEEDISLIGSGRTDAGVHACGQVANARTTTRHALTTIQRALNALLPEDISVRQAWEAPVDFHARFSAIRRDYRYLLLLEPWRSPRWRRYAVHVPEALDLAAMDEAARGLIGVHDFAAFGSTTDGPTIRECFLATCRESRRDGLRFAVIDLAASGFLRHMVRTIVGTLLLVGRGALAPEAIAVILASRDRAQAGPTAPPHGLYLMSVTYPEHMRG